LTAACTAAVSVGPDEAIIGRDGDAITIAVEKLATIHRDRDVAMARALPTVEASRNTYEREPCSLRFHLLFPPLFPWPLAVTSQRPEVWS